MNTNHKTIILSTVLGLTVLLGGVTASAQATTCINLQANVRIKATGSSVTQLQDFLHAQGYLSAKSTGYFGPLTLHAVQSFQSARHFPQTGFVGPLTRGEIQKTTCSTQQSSTTATSTATSINTNASLQAATIQAISSVNISNSNVNLPFQSSAFDGWTGVEGAVATTSTGTLLVNASTTSQGAKALFPSSGNWTDYKYSADVTISNGEVALIARYVDSGNYLSCTFYNNIIDIRQHLNGQETTLASTQLYGLSDMQFLDKSTVLAIRVKGNTIGCTEMGGSDNVTATNVDNSLLKGGIGISTWFQDQGSAHLELRDINVVSI